MSLISKIFSKPSGKIEDTEDDTNPALNITELPQDVLGEIFSHLRDLNDLMDLRLVSKSFKEAAELKFSWKNIAESMGIDAADFKSFMKEITVYADDVKTNWLQADVSVANIIQRFLAFRSKAYLYSLDEDKKLKPLEIINQFDKWTKNKNNSVVKLKLYGCQTKYLPRSIGNLKTLKKLCLFGNELTVLPNEIWDLNNLKVLNISNNKFEILSENIGKLKNLEKLDLSGNEFTAIPDTILNLPKLEYLAISEKLIDIDVIKKLKEKEIHIEIIW